MRQIKDGSVPENYFDVYSVKIVSSLFPTGKSRSFATSFCCSNLNMHVVLKTLLASKRLIFLSLATVVIINLILIACYQFEGVINEASSLFKIDTNRRIISLLLNEVETNKTRFWLTNTELQHLDVKIPLSDILPSDDDKQHLYWDPRFTMAAYLNELSHIKETDNTPELPFHWADWIDLTPLNNKMAQLNDPYQLTCRRLRKKIRTYPNTDYFCKENENLSDEEVFESGFLSKAHMPAAVIFGHCKHEHPSFNDVRVFMAKSYALTNLPKPYKVIILNRNNQRGVFEFAVDQKRSPQQRLLYSGLTQNLIGNSTVTEVEGVSMLSFNHKEFFNTLTEKISPRVLAPEEDIHSLNDIVTAKSGMKILSLDKKMFANPLDETKKIIEEYQTKANRSIFEENFLAGFKECQLYDGGNEPTYFKMSVLDVRERANYKNDWGWHYDWRFFSDLLFFNKNGWTDGEHTERTNIILERLLRSWNRFAEEKGIISWIMHGPLLSWYWDGLMFPYDHDIDIQMPVSELIRLSKDYNQTLVVENPEEGYGKFLIDIGSYIHNRDISTTGNHIDGRFIDVDSGIYIDITGLSKSSAKLPDAYRKAGTIEKDENDADAEVYNDRRKHFYTIDMIQPLRYSMMDGVPLFVPNKIEQSLKFEYSSGLDKYEYDGWIFVPMLQLWIKTHELMGILSDEEKMKDGKEDLEKIVESVKSMSEESVVNLLKTNDNILREYYLTKDLSEWHLKEKSILFDEGGDDMEAVINDVELRSAYENLISEVSWKPPLRMCLYEYEYFERTAHTAN